MSEHTLELASVLNSVAPNHVTLTWWGEAHMFRLANMYHLLNKLDVGVYTDGSVVDSLCVLDIRMMEVYTVGCVRTYRLHSANNWWEFKMDVRHGRLL